MKIPDEAIEAGAEAVVAHVGRFRETWNIDPSEFTEEARAVIEAAFPALMAEAWDRGRSAGATSVMARMEKGLNAANANPANPYRIEGTQP